MRGALLYDPARLAACLAAHGCDALLASTAANVRYLTRYTKPGGALAIVTADAPDRPQLVLPASNVDFLVEDLADGVEAHAYGTFFRFTAEGAQLTEGEALVARVSADARTDVDADALAAELLGDAARVASDVVVRELRAVKTPEELARLREAARIAEEAIDETVAAARPGVTQAQLAARFTAAVAERGAALRMDNISFGRSSALGNANLPGDVLEAGQVLRFDVGAVFRGYASDLSRCFVVGEPEARTATYHRALVAGVCAALDAVRPGARAADVFAAGVGAVREAGIAHYERTNVGHGIGLAGDGYDAPLLAPGEEAVLEEGMALCVETPYYELGFGGLQVEDMVRVTHDGWEPLSRLHRELVEIG
jgi:Xaa-Pro dipeptidase